MDFSVTDHGVELTMNQTISTATDGSSALGGQKLKCCSCGWSKLTSVEGLKIHQGKKKCLSKLSKGSHTDQYFLRSRPNQLSEAQRQENPHSPQGISTSDETQHHTDHPPVSSSKSSQLQPAAVLSLDANQPQFLAQSPASHSQH